MLLSTHLWTMCAQHLTALKGNMFKRLSPVTASVPSIWPTLIMQRHLSEASSPSSSPVYLSPSNRESGECCPAWCPACSSATMLTGHWVQSVSELQFNYLTRVLLNHSWTEGGQRCVQYEGGRETEEGERRGVGARYIINTNPVQHGYRFKCCFFLCD